MNKKQRKYKIEFSHKGRRAYILAADDELTMDALFPRARRAMDRLKPEPPVDDDRLRSFLAYVLSRMDEE